MDIFFVEVTEDTHKLFLIFVFDVFMLEFSNLNLFIDTAIS